MTKATDVYAFALVVLFIASGKDPFDDVDMLNYPFERIKGVMPRVIENLEFCSEFARMIEQCLSTNPMMRPSMHDVMSLIKNFKYAIISTVDQAAVQCNCQRFILD